MNEKIFNKTSALKYLKDRGIKISRQFFLEHQKSGYITPFQFLETKSTNIPLFNQSELDKYVKWYKVNIALRNKGIIGKKQLIKRKGGEN
jgi:hypothetical protein